MGRADEGVTPVLFLRTTDARFPLYRLDIGPAVVNNEPANYWFGVFDMAQRSWLVLTSGQTPPFERPRRTLIPGTTGTMGPGNPRTPGVVSVVTRARLRE